VRSKAERTSDKNNLEWNRYSVTRNTLNLREELGARHTALDSARSDQGFDRSRLGDAPPEIIFYRHFNIAVYE
jgi:hypothetical protein